MSCVFCDRIASGEVLLSNEHAAAFHDGYPLNPGHTLIVPRRHEADFLALSLEEQQAIWALVSPARALFGSAGPTPDGYNVGINIGEAAGQTIAHAHLHLVPRYRGDVQDPRGGVRWVVPARAAYWEQR